MFENPPTPADAHALAIECLEAGIAAARPAEAIDRCVRLRTEDRTSKDAVLEIYGTSYDLGAYETVLVLGGGKAADDLAVALEQLLGDRLDGGVVVTKDQTATSDRIAILEGEHPVPGSESVAGSSAVLEAAAAADERTLVLAAITGGGSALLCAPAEDLELADLQTVTDELLDSGATIEEINAVRRPLSRIKGSGLAAEAAPATVVGLLVSDVVGDDPAVIASGPTVPTETGPEDALEVLDRYDVDAPEIRAWLETAAETGSESDGDDRERAEPQEVDNYVIVSGRDAIDAAGEPAREAGYETRVLSARIEGEAREIGRVHAAIAAEIRATGEPIEPPAVVLSGGETTVTVTGNGVGGPNLETVLAAGIDLPDGAVFAAVDTDGSDGSTDVAGAIVDAETIGDLPAAREALDDNDSYRFLEECGALLRSGPTGTNVNDLRILVVP